MGIVEETEAKIKELNDRLPALQGKAFKRERQLVNKEIFELQNQEECARRCTPGGTARPMTMRHTWCVRAANLPPCRRYVMASREQSEAMRKKEESQATAVLLEKRTLLAPHVRHATTA
jgi:hypothetical protein